MEKVVYSVREIAAILNIGMNKAYDMIHERKIPAIKMGKVIRIPKKAFDNWLNSLSITEETCADVSLKKVPNTL